MSAACLRYGARFLCAALVLLLASCGGGGGGGGSSGPTLSVSTTSVTFTAIQNQSTPATQNVGVSVSGGTVFVGVTSVTGPFSAPFTITGATTGNIAITPTVSTSFPGTHTGSITVRGCGDVSCATGDVAGSPKVISVTYTIQPQTGLRGSPTSMVFTQVQGGTAPTAQTLGLSDAQSLSYAWNASIIPQTGGTGWLTLNSAATASGTALPASISVNVVPSSATLGANTAIIRVTGNGSTLDVPVSYTVNPPSLTFNPSANFIITTSSTASALSQTVSVGSTGAPVSWTAASNQPWVTVSPTSGTTGSSVTLSLDPAQLDTLDPGSRSAVITFTYTPSGGFQTSLGMPVSLLLQIPKVTSVNPYVATSGTSREVILRGLGFANLGLGDIKFGSSTVTTYTILNDTEVHVTHPSLTAGSHRVSFANQLGNPAIVRSTADLVVVDAPAYVAATIAYPDTNAKTPLRIVYDAERQALLVGVRPPTAPGLTNGSTIYRYAFSGSWSATPAPAAISNLRDLALSPDGKKLLAVTDAAMTQLDSATLVAGISTNANFGPFSTHFLNQIAAANNGKSVVTTSLFGSGFTEAFLYSTSDGALTQLSGLAGSFFVGRPGASANGSTIVVVQGSLSPADWVYRYSASTNAFSQTSLASTANIPNPVLDRDATRVLIGGMTVYDLNFQQLGIITLASTVVLSPDGSKAYTYSSGIVRAFNLAATPVAGVFPEIGSGTATPSDPGAGTVMTISPDGGTLFIAGDAAIVVMPAP